MIFYKPIDDLNILKAEFPYQNFDENIYGGYLGFDEEQNNVGKCLMKIQGYNCYILSLECDYNDKLLVEGFLRAALNFCGNRNAYMAHCPIDGIRDVLEHLGFEENGGIFNGDIPSLLKGSCCK